MTAKALKIVCLGIFVLLLGIPSMAQNTKGDRPAPTSRETRFKTPKKSTKQRTGRRVRRGDDRPDQRSAVAPRKARTRERAGRPVTPMIPRSRPRNTQRAWKGDITGRRIEPRPSTGRAINVYPQPPTTNYSSRSLKRTLRQNDNPNVKRVQRMQRDQSSRPKVGKPIRPVFHKSRPQRSERAWRGDITGRKIRAGRTTSRPATEPNFSRAARGVPGSMRRKGTIPPRISGRARNVYSDKSFYVNNQRLSRQRAQRRAAFNISRQQTGQPGSGGGFKKVTPRSASAAYLSRRSTNTWAHFRRAKRKQEQAITTDLAGRKIRGRNYETPRPVLMNPTLNYKRRIASGERPYRGPAAGGHVSRTQPGRAWKGDITHRAIRGGSKKGEPKAGAALFGRGPGKQARRTGRYQGNIRAGNRGFADQGEKYSGNLRARRLLQGGGSVTRGWNNKGLPIQGRTPGKGSSAIGYSGNIRTGKRILNDQGEEYSGNLRQDRRRGFSDQGEEYSGSIRRGNRGFSDQGEEYSGNIRFNKALKGGGSRSGKHWNNNNTPIQGRTPEGRSAGMAAYQGNIRGRRILNDQGEEFTGSIKARRPAKGGGSVSGQIWNNKERPLEAKDYSGQKRLSRYSGDVKEHRYLKGGGSVSGKLWNNKEKPITVRAPKNDAERNYSGDIKLARSDYKRNPKSAMGAMEGKRASLSAVKADQYDRGIKRNWNYVRNPSSADEAQDVREPGRAFGRSADYQGNIRLKNFDLFAKSDLHPDARFVRTNKNNVAEEKDMLTNFKLWWSRLFRKSETQPDHLKEDEKDHKPRYDKGEAGLWYD